MRKTTLFYIAAAAVFLICGCGKKVTRIEPESVMDLSGRWNDTDSRLVAETLINQMLESSWYRAYADRHGKKPVMIVGRVANKTMEHIDVQTFIKDLERAVINSGRIKIVASSSEREEVRHEREQMQQWASLESRKALGQETAADYMLKGVLNSIIDEEKGKKVVYYQVDLSLINLENNNIIWTGQKKIKKYIKKPLFKF